MIVIIAIIVFLTGLAMTIYGTSLLKRCSFISKGLVPVKVKIGSEWLKGYMYRNAVIKYNTTNDRESPVVLYKTKLGESFTLKVRDIEQMIIMMKETD